MSVSFFPQNGTFNQLISTGSIELIDSKEFRRVLLNNYTHYYDRNSANNRTLDDLYLAFGANIDPKITVTSTEQDDASFIYSDMVVSSYDIDQKFYLSNTFKAYLLTAQSLSLIHISEPTRRSTIAYAVFCLKKFFFNDTATTEIYTELFVGSVRCV